MSKVTIVLGLKPCLENACDIINPSKPMDVGDVLFIGQLIPMVGGPPRFGLHQNITVEVPELESGPALLTLTQMETVSANAAHGRCDAFGVGRSCV